MLFHRLFLELTHFFLVTFLFGLLPVAFFARLAHAIAHPLFPMCQTNRLAHIILQLWFLPARPEPINQVMLFHVEIGDVFRPHQNV